MDSFIHKPSWMSQLQWQIVNAKRQGHAYRDIQVQFQLANQQCISRCLMRAALGLTWDKTHSGGNDSYLAPDDEYILRADINDAVEELNCLSASQVTSLAHNLKLNRALKARIFLLQLGCTKLADAVDTSPEEPGRGWISSFCARNNLNITWRETLEETRRLHCTTGRVRRWLSTYRAVIDSYNPMLIFNMDETSLNASMRKYKVVTHGTRGLKSKMGTNQHITACVTVGMGCPYVKPHIILEDKKRLPHELAEFQLQAHFYSTRSGWMLKETFLQYAINFAADITNWRKSLPGDMRYQRILLIVDGHGSRKCPEAIRHLYASGIDVLVLPGHCTHVLQPFDVSLAGPLKAEIRKETERIMAKMTAGHVTQARNPTAARRWLLVYCFLEAYARTCTLGRVREAFRSAHIFESGDTIVSDYVRASVDDPPEDWINSKYFGWPAHMKVLHEMCGMNVPQAIVALTPVEREDAMRTMRSWALTAMATEI